MYSTTNSICSIMYHHNSVMFLQFLKKLRYFENHFVMALILWDAWTLQPRSDDISNSHMVGSSDDVCIGTHTGCLSQIGISFNPWNGCGVTCSLAPVSRAAAKETLIRFHTKSWTEGKCFCGGLMCMYLHTGHVRIDRNSDRISTFKMWDAISNQKPHAGEQYLNKAKGSAIHCSWERPLPVTWPWHHHTIIITSP